MVNYHSRLFVSEVPARLAASFKAGPTALLLCNPAEHIDSPIVEDSSYQDYS